MKINEARSKYLNMLSKIEKDSDLVLMLTSTLVGAASFDEITTMVSKSLSAASNLIAFAHYFIQDNTVEKESVEGNYNKLLKITQKLKMLESKKVDYMVEGLYVDPYESEYLPDYMQTGSNFISEDYSPLPDDLDDDPDAVITLDVNGLPVKFNNSPIDVDPFAIKLFRNNSELVDPPSEFVPPSAGGTENEFVNQVIDTLADIDSIDSPEVTLDIDTGSEFTADSFTDTDANDSDFDITTDIDTENDFESDNDTDDDFESDTDTEIEIDINDSDFDVYAAESKSLAKNSSGGVLPPQFNTQMANEHIADDTGNNLKMLSLLMQDW